MAFCPNCGTPNTDQADKCVSCGFELSPQQKSKFKGTMMMTPGQTPKAPPGAPPAAPAQNNPARAAGGKNMAFDKTMMGAAGATSAPPPAAPVRPVQPGSQTARGGFTQPQAAAGHAQPAHAPQLDLGRASSGVDFGSYAPPAPKTNTGKILAIGCACVLVLACVLGFALYSMAKEKLQGLLGSTDSGQAQAQEWQATVAQSLSQIAAVCQTDCSSAAVYFHPQAEAALAEAKQLTPIRATQLAESADASMLEGTQDAPLAEELGLDPSRCVRVTLGEAKAVACSVPEPGGQASLRIVALSGLATL